MIHADNVDFAAKKFLSLAEHFRKPTIALVRRKLIYKQPVHIEFVADVYPHKSRVIGNRCGEPAKKELLTVDHLCVGNEVCIFYERRQEPESAHPPVKHRNFRFEPIFPGKIENPDEFFDERVAHVIIVRLKQIPPQVNPYVIDAERRYRGKIFVDVVKAQIPPRKEPVFRRNVIHSEFQSVIDKSVHILTPCVFCNYTTRAALMQ